MMSHDRIEFTLTCHGRELEATAKAAARAFGLTPNQATRALLANCESGTRVRCRPSQFGRFIVFRVEEGVECNRVKELSPEILKAPPPVDMDVSSNPAERS